MVQYKKEHKKKAWIYDHCYLKLKDQPKYMIRVDKAKGKIEKKKEVERRPIGRKAAKETLKRKADDISELVEIEREQLKLAKERNAMERELIDHGYMERSLEGLDDVQRRFFELKRAELLEEAEDRARARARARTEDEVEDEEEVVEDEEEAVEDEEVVLVEDEE